jgi:hypothetical protein
LNWRTVAVASGAVVVVVCGGLALSNPSLARYQNLVLSPLAEVEAQKLAQADRRAIEQEAARINAIFASVHYDPHKIDAATLQETHPWLGKLLVNQDKAAGQTFPESLELAKQRAFAQVDLMHKVVFHEVLEQFTVHTTRTSYGLWSTFTTCGAGKTLRYTGVVRAFYEQTDSHCPPQPPEN